MVVLIDCPSCDVRFTEPEGEPDGPVETECLGCGQTFTASSENQLALPEAAGSGSLEVVEALLETGADPTAPDGDGETSLHKAAREGHPYVAEVLLKAGADPTEVDNAGRMAAECMAASSSRKIRTTIADHPDGPDELIDLMVRAGSREDLSGLSEREPEPISEEKREHLHKTGSYGRKLLGAHPDTPPKELSKLADDKNRLVRVSVAENRSTPAQVFGGLADDPDEKVRAAVAENEAAPAEVLERLTDDPCVEVRKALGSNSGAPKTVLEKLANDPSEGVRKNVVENPNTSADMLFELAEEFPDSFLQNPILEVLALEDPAWRERLPVESLQSILSDPGVSTECIEWGASHDDYRVREAVAEHPDLSRSLVEKLLADSHSKVRKRAAKHSKAPDDLLDLIERAGGLRFKMYRRFGEESWRPNPPDPLTEEERIRLFDAGPWGRALVGRHPGTSESVLRRLSNHEEKEAQLAIARNPSTPADVLEELAEHDWWEIRHNVAQNPSVPEETLWQLLTDPDHEVGLAGLKNPNLPDRFLDRLPETDHGTVILNMPMKVERDLPAEAAEKLLKKLLGELDHHTDMRARLAGREELPGRLLRKLAEDQVATVRAAVAKNPSTPEEVLVQLGSDSDAKVREAVGSNQNAPVHALMKVASVPRPECREAVANHPLLENDDVPQDLLLELAGSRKPGVRAIAVNHPNFPEEVQNLLVRAGGTPDLQDVQGQLHSLDKEEKGRLRDIEPWGWLLLARRPDVATEVLIDLVGYHPGWDLIKREGVLSKIQDRLEEGRLPENEVLRLAQHGPQSLCEWIAKWKGAPPGALKRLARRENEEIRRQVVAHPECPPGPLARIVEDGGKDISRTVVNRPDAPPEALETLSEKNAPWIRRAVAQHPNAPSEVIRRLLDDARPEVRESAAAHPEAPAPDVHRVVQETSARRCLVLLREGAGSETLLRALAETADVDVRRAVAKHPDAPSDALGTLLEESSDPALRRRVAAHPNAPAEALGSLAEAEDWRVRAAVASNRAAPESLLAELAEDSEVNVRWAVARRESLPAASLAGLATDSDPGVRWIARTNSELPSAVVDLLVRAGSTPDLQEWSGSPQPLTETEAERLQDLGPWAQELLARHPTATPNYPHPKRQSPSIS